MKTLGRLIGVVLALVVGLQLALPGAAQAAPAMYKGFPYGQCTWYAATEFDKVAPAPGADFGRHGGFASGNAAFWVDNARLAGWVVTRNVADAPDFGIVVWRGGSAGQGHVAIVRGRTSQGIYVQDMNRDAKGTGTITGPTFLKFSQIDGWQGLRFSGYIYPSKRQPNFRPMWLA